MRYLQQINRAVDFIENNLRDDMPVVDIAAEAGLSLWHFQRIFAATVGETVKTYVAARRLSGAAKALVQTDARIIDIALDAGFNSNEAFSRAFKRMFSETPSAFRSNKKDAFPLPLKARVTPQYLDHLYKGINMTPEIVTIEEFSVVGMAGHFAPLMSKSPDNMEVIPALWRQLGARAAELPAGQTGQRVGVIGGAEAPEGRLDYLAGRKQLSDFDPPHGFEQRTLPKGTFAKFTHTGPVANIAHTMNYIFGAWLPKSGMELREGAEFALYPDSYQPDSPDGEIYIHIPVVSEGDKD